MLLFYHHVRADDVSDVCRPGQSCFDGGGVEKGWQVGAEVMGQGQLGGGGVADGAVFVEE